MNRREIMEITGELIDSAKAAVLSFDGGGGRPEVRWMTPALLKDCPFSIFSVTFPKSPKIEKLLKNPQVEWMIQNPSLTKIINVRGRVKILEDPGACCRVMEQLASRLTAFWKVNPESTDFVVLETIIEEAVCFMPMKGTFEKVTFREVDE